MNLCINYIDSEINLSQNAITSIEIENQSLFYHFVNDFNLLSQGNLLEEISLFDNDKEINIVNKFLTIIDYFNLDFNNKKNLSNLYKLIGENITEEQFIKINNYYDKIQDIFSDGIDNVSLPLEIKSEFDVESIIKLLKMSIVAPEKIMEKLLLLIDIQKEFQSGQIITLINIKQLLTKEELTELYKYAIYNQIYLFLIDYGYYGVTLENEKKIVIDDSLEEFVL